MGSDDVSLLHPQTKRHLLNSQRLRDAAVQEFAQHGLHGAKVGNIVAAANLTQPSFYRMWASKEEAFDEIVDQTVDLWLRAASGILKAAQPCPLSVRIHSGLEQLFNCLLEHPALTRMVISVKHHSEEMHHQFLNVYTEAVRQAQEQGHITLRQRSETLALAYYGLTEQFFSIHLYQQDKDPGATLDDLTRLIFLIMKKEGSE